MAATARSSEFTLGPSCPPVGAESLIPVCRALAVASWGSSTEADGGNDSFQQASTQPQVFSTRRPRDAIAGFTSGAKTLSRSLAAGATALASAPCEGAKADNFIGMLRGVGENAASALLLPCAGAAVAVAQCARGVANTPTAVVQALQGLQWDEAKRVWLPTTYSLQEEARLLRRQRHRTHGAAYVSSGAPAEAMGSEEDNAVFPASSSSQRHPKQRSGKASSSSSFPGTVKRYGRCDSGGYYSLLQVHPKATPDEIRRAYYKASRRCHPDKVGGDRHAVAQFQKLSEAYKVLRSPELRRAYDRGGNEAVNRLSTTVDLGTLYSVVMSGAQWEPYIGRLALSRVLAADTHQDTAVCGPSCLDSLAQIWCAGDCSVDAWQTQREVRCAMVLADRLRPALRGDEARFEQSIRDDALRLADAPFAPAMLKVIAAVYDSEALRFLGALRLFDPRREMTQARAQTRLMLCQAHAAVTGFRAVLALHSLLEDEDGGSTIPDGDSSWNEGSRAATSLCLERPAVQAQLPTLATALWSFTVLDIEGTLRRVCRRVLRDSSEDLSARVRRATALRRAAAAFREVADARVAAASSDIQTSTNAPCSPGAVGAPGEDADLLRNCLQEAAIHVAGGNKHTCSAAGFGSDGDNGFDL